MASGNHRTGSPARLLVGTLLALCVGVVACASSQPVQAAMADFNGVWSVKLCDEANPQLQCGSFDLYLTQKGDRICGDHFVATPGLSRLDESDPGTVIGTFSGKSAVLLIKSTRNNAWYLAHGEISGTDLVWRRVGMAVAGLDDEQDGILTLQLLRESKPLTVSYKPRGETVATWQWQRKSGIAETNCSLPTTTHAEWPTETFSDVKVGKSLA